MRAANYWAIATTKWNEEERAASHVERQEFDHWLPRMSTFTQRGAERRSLMFPGYLFFKVRQGWEAICCTKGVASVMLCDGRPARVRQEEFDYLRSLEDKRGLVVLPPRFGNGDAVQITQGQYQGVRGVVQGTSVAGRLRVLWAMLGRDVHASIPEGSLSSA